MLTPAEQSTDDHNEDRHAAPDGGPEEVRRHVEIDASPEEVWEAIATEEGREHWLEPDPARALQVEVADAPRRIVWWWWHEDESPRRVELEIVAAPAGSRVTVIESAPPRPGFPLGALAASFALVLA